ncbi:cobalamin B12-binding domain-containing protein [Agilicoccus flavus]|uniref:cobalamin B12-binding domain-containing protein n=1 Tax=Agilicoccus flavus TaxID=2775968 RepID=UPI001CF6C19B|nr:B12-binding domain-containing protein [Agilicoccus flavus]
MSVQVAERDARVEAVGDAFFDAASRLDSNGMREALVECSAVHGVDVVVADVIVPALRRIGDLWEEGRLSVLHEHVASQVIRSVVDDFGQSADREGRPAVVLACPPGELHELPSHLFAAMLRVRGWVPIVLGANTPWRATVRSLSSFRAQACLISGIRAGSLASRGAGLSRMARSVCVLCVSLSSRLDPRIVFSRGSHSQPLRARGRAASSGARRP